MTVAKKMVLLVATALLGIIVLAGAAQIQINKVFEETNYTNENVVPSMHLLGLMQNNVYRTRIRLNRHILNTDNSQSKKIEASMNEAITEVKAGLKEYETMIADDKDRALLKESVDAFNRYLTHIPAIIVASENDQFDLARELLEKATPDAMAVSTAIDNQSAYNMDIAEGAKNTALASKAQATLYSIVISAITLIAIAVIGFFITRNLLRQLGGEPDYAAAVVAKIAAGDLTQEVAVKQGDTTSMLAAIREMSNTLSQVLGEVRSSADALASASEEVNATAQSLAKGASVQAASVEETSASMEEMSASIMQNNENASITDGMAQKAAADAMTGGNAVASTVEAMQKIADRIGVIDDIAYQTNLLALNAAIEAGRAGEHGRGFAVVASEVRKLAERSQVAAQEIGSLAGETVSKADNAGKLLQEMVPSIRKTADLVQEISAASTEQTAGVNQINAAIGQVSQTMQQNAAAAEELSSTSEELSSQAMRLQDAVSYFVLAKSDARVIVPRASQKSSGNFSPSATTPSRNKPQKKIINDDDLDKDFVRYS
ncbi:methyl-accepting chemotaxis protein [Cellvibrio sp. pealriver]|uniref:methyl-accepting chemotaxis protein n=1 Tax=Cellvibrio sp. pealriver TaxID=1622269 RepID=UPI0009E4AD54|nr:methyl-accepting chemotaxis protein [Cellvibrio sp. pealriver]